MERPQVAKRKSTVEVSESALKNFDGGVFEKPIVEVLHEPRRIPHGYVSIEQRADGHIAVRPDGQGDYPTKDQVEAAVLRDVFFVYRLASEGVSAEEVAFVARHHHKSKEWMLSATDALRAVHPELKPDEAKRRVGVVIQALCKKYSKNV